MSNYHDSHEEMGWALDPSWLRNTDSGITQVYRYVPAGNIDDEQPAGLPVFWYSEVSKCWMWGIYGYGNAVRDAQVPYSAKSVDEIKAWVIAAWRTQ